MRRPGTEAAFTLVELMIVVAMIGVLAMIAIPNFITYQARARRSEAYANLSALARTEKSYFAEAGIFYETLTFPDPGAAGANLGTWKQVWNAAADAEFAEVGWTPEGNVFYSYDVNTGATACDCGETCFTATAYGDVDGDDGLSAVMYVKPQVDQATGAILTECPSHLFGFGTPVRPKTGVKVFDEVAVNRSTDEY